MAGKEGLSRTKKIAFTAVCLALCVLLPYAFHTVPNAATVFCPMHIPVLLCALSCGWGYGLICGAAGPPLCFLCTGMPAAGELFPLTGECIVYGVSAGLLMKGIRTGRFYLDCYLSLASAMLLGRVAGGLLQALLFESGGYSFSVWATAYLLRGFPAILIQLFLIPNLLFGLTKAKLLPERYPKKKQAFEEEGYEEDL